MLTSLLVSLIEADDKKTYDENEWMPIAQPCEKCHGEQHNLQKKASERILNLNENGQNNNETRDARQIHDHRHYPKEIQPQINYSGDNAPRKNQQFYQVTPNVEVTQAQLQHYFITEEVQNNPNLKQQQALSNQQQTPINPLAYQTNDHLLKQNNPGAQQLFLHQNQRAQGVLFQRPQQFLLPQSEELPHRKQSNVAAQNQHLLQTSNVAAHNQLLSHSPQNSFKENQFGNHEDSLQKPQKYYEELDITSTTPKVRDQNVQLLYVPLEQLQSNRGTNAYQGALGEKQNTATFNRAPLPTYENYQNTFEHKQRQLQDVESDFIQQALEAHKLQQQLQQGRQIFTVPLRSPTTITTTTTTSRPVVRRRKPHQPPLAVFMEGRRNAPVSEVLNLLKDAKSIDVHDAVGPQTPQVFVGPANLDPPDGYSKFDLPYLSNIDSNRVERKVTKLPFFVAPLNYNTPPGYAKIPFPSPHVGSVVVSRDDYGEELPAGVSGFTNHYQDGGQSQTGERQRAFAQENGGYVGELVQDRPIRIRGRIRTKGSHPVQNVPRTEVQTSTESVDLTKLGQIPELQARYPEQQIKFSVPPSENPYFSLSTLPDVGVTSESQSSTAYPFKEQPTFQGIYSNAADKNLEVQALKQNDVEDVYENIAETTPVISPPLSTSVVAQLHDGFNYKTHSPVQVQGANIQQHDYDVGQQNKGYFDYKLAPHAAPISNEKAIYQSGNKRANFSPVETAKHAETPQALRGNLGDIFAIIPSRVSSTQGEHVDIPNLHLLQSHIRQTNTNVNEAIDKFIGVPRATTSNLNEIAPQRHPVNVNTFEDATYKTVLEEFPIRGAQHAAAPPSQTRDGADQLSQPPIKRKHSQRGRQRVKDHLETQPQLPDIPPVLPSLINNLQDQSVRQLLAPALLAPSSGKRTRPYEINALRERPVYKQQQQLQQQETVRPVYSTETTTQPNIRELNDYQEEYVQVTTTTTTTTPPPVVHTVARSRGRGRGHSRYQLGTTTSSPRRVPQKVRAQPARVRGNTRTPHTLDETTVSMTTEYVTTGGLKTRGNERIGEYTTTAIAEPYDTTSRQRFRTRGRPVVQSFTPAPVFDAYTTTEGVKLEVERQTVRDYQPAAQQNDDAPHVIVKSQTLTPEEEYLINKYNLDYANFPTVNPLVQDQNGDEQRYVSEGKLGTVSPPVESEQITTTTTTTTSPYTTSAPKQPPEHSPVRIKTRIRGRPRLKQTTTTTTTEKYVEKPDEFYGFFRSPSFANGAANTDTPSYLSTQSLYVPTADEEVLPEVYVGDSAGSPDRRVHVYTNNQVSASTPVQFVGQIIPKYDDREKTRQVTTEEPTTIKTVESTTQRARKQRVRSRTRRPVEYHQKSDDENEVTTRRNPHRVKNRNRSNYETSGSGTNGESEIHEVQNVQRAQSARNTPSRDAHVSRGRQNVRSGLRYVRPAPSRAIDENGRRNHPDDEKVQKVRNVQNALVARDSHGSIGPTANGSPYDDAPQSLKTVAENVESVNYPNVNTPQNVQEVIISKDSALSKNTQVVNGVRYDGLGVDVNVKKGDHPILVELQNVQNSREVLTSKQASRIGQGDDAQVEQQQQKHQRDGGERHGGVQENLYTQKPFQITIDPDYNAQEDQQPFSSIHRPKIVPPNTPNAKRFPTNAHGSVNDIGGGGDEELESAADDHPRGDEPDESRVVSEARETEFGHGTTDTNNNSRNVGEDEETTLETNDFVDVERGSFATNGEETGDRNERENGKDVGADVGRENETSRDDNDVRVDAKNELKNATGHESSSAEQSDSVRMSGTVLVVSEDDFAGGGDHKSRRRGYWKLIRQRPADGFEAEESQNVPVVSANSYHFEEKQEATKSDDDRESVTFPNPQESTTIAVNAELAEDELHPQLQLQFHGSSDEPPPLTTTTVPEIPEEITGVEVELTSHPTPVEGVVKTSTSSEISHETEMCYKGVCVKSKGKA